MRTVIAGLCLILLSIPAAIAEPVIKVVNFTASWCPNCRILDPRLAEALADYDQAAVKLVELDLTKAGRRYSQAERMNAEVNAIRTVEANQARYLWDWYGGITGLAVVIAADSGEPITCFTPRQSVDDIRERLHLARLVVENTQPESRQTGELACPPPR